MRDAISVQRGETLHPLIRQEAITAIANAEAGFPANVRIRIAQALRTIDEQNALYAKGRTTPGPKVTNAPGGSSYHNYGLAIDFCILYHKNNDGNFEELSWDIAKDLDRDGKSDWSEVVAAFENLGWEWGGRFRTFKDYPHVQRTFGYSPSKLKARYDAGMFLPGTKYVKL
jgi:peptidoglycan L-alanyl-D-glutamate endopeptidase CwlK